MASLKDKITDILGKFLVALTALMVVNVTWQVLSRFLAQMKVIAQPSSFTDELAGFLLMWVGLLGASYASAKRLHLAIDLLVQKSSPENQLKLNTMINGFVALFALAVMVVGGINLCYMTLILAQTSPTLKIPMGYVYSVVPISGMLIIYYSLMNIVEDRANASA